MVRTLRRIHRNHQVVGPQPVPLSILVTEDTRLQQLVVTVVDARHYKGRAEGQLLILIEEVVWVAVQDHAAYGLQGEDILGPDLGHIQRVKVKPGSGGKGSRCVSIHGSLQETNGNGVQLKVQIFQLQPQHSCTKP